VVLLGIAVASVLVAGCLLVGLLDLWCHIVAEVVGGFHRLVVKLLRVWDLHLR
jgi:hypothetical protein